MSSERLYSLSHLAQKASEFGYNLAETVDYTLIAIPWTDRACAGHKLAQVLCTTLHGKTVEGPKKALHGRKEWTITCEQGKLTLSTIPRIATDEQRASKREEMLKRNIQIYTDYLNEGLEPPDLAVKYSLRSERIKTILQEVIARRYRADMKAGLIRPIPDPRRRRPDTVTRYVERGYILVINHAQDDSRVMTYRQAQLEADRLNRLRTTPETGNPESVSK